MGGGSRRGRAMAFMRPSLTQDASLLLKAGTVQLRPPEMADFFAWSELREASMAHLTPFEPQWTLDELSKPAFRERIRRYHRDIKDDQGYAFFIFTDYGRQLVGAMTLSNVRRGVAQAAAVGYWIGKPFTQRGFGTSALAAVALFAFEEIRLHRLEAACMPANIASLRTLERGGFSREGLARRYLKINGVWEDHVLFGLPREDWSEARFK